MDMQEALQEACAAAFDVPTKWARATPGAQLRALRTSRGISQRHLAESSGVHQSVVCRLEYGADARWSTWKRLFEGLGYDVVLVPLSTSDDVEDMLLDEKMQREDRIEAGRLKRW